MCYLLPVGDCITALLLAVEGCCLASLALTVVLAMAVRVGLCRQP